MTYQEAVEKLYKENARLKIRHLFPIMCTDRKIQIKAQQIKDRQHEIVEIINSIHAPDIQPKVKNEFIAECCNELEAYIKKCAEIIN